jgi:hypothetical protein
MIFSSLFCTSYFFAGAIVSFIRQEACHNADGCGNLTFWFRINTDLGLFFPTKGWEGEAPAEPI